MWRRMNFVGDFYRRVMAMFSDRPMHFSWVDEWVAGSARPMKIEQVKWIKNQGIDVIISLTETPLPEEWVKEVGLGYFHFPIEDHSCPDPEILKRIVDRILDEIASGKRVLVHCAAGLGRTGTVLAAYLMIRNNLMPREAVEALRKMRPGSIEARQERALFDFYEFRRGHQA